MSRPPTIAETMAEWRQFMASSAGWTYLARRVRAGSRALVGETLRLERWLRVRAVFNRGLG